MANSLQSIYMLYLEGFELARTVFCWCNCAIKCIFCSFSTPILVGLMYVVIVTKIGPMFMDNCKPFSLKNTLLIYNFGQVV